MSSVPGPILHLPVSYLPWTVGGKEVYCHRLGKQLRRLGVDSRVAVHSDSMNKSPPGLYEHEGVPVHVLEPIQAARRRQSIYSCTPDSIPGFAQLLDEIRPPIVHFHDFSAGGASVQHMREAKRAGARVVMAYQSVGQTCLQRSLWLGGNRANVCDGWISQERCTRCRLVDRGAPEVLAQVAVRLPFLPIDAESSSPLARFLSAPHMTAHFIRAWQECVSLVDMFHTGAAWATELLKLNGVAAERVRHIRHGVSLPTEEPGADFERAKGLLTVGIIGRSDPVKGHHVLIDAVRRLPRDARIRVLLIGPAIESDYGRALRASMGDDPRFEVRPPVPQSALLRAMREFDVLAVPSLWMETGPQVVIDAFSVGVPVIGSRLGGIAELVRDGVDGLLFKADDAGEMAGVLARLLDDPGALQRMRSSIPAARYIDEVAQDILELYASLQDRPRDRRSAAR